MSPAEYNNVVTVAATNDADGRGFFHAVDPDVFELETEPASNYGSAVDISAPGVDIISTNWSQGGSCGPHKYCAVSGTSLAAPMVSGVAALLASRGFYGCEIVETLTELDRFGNPISADPITWSGGGVGRLNAQKALEWWGGGPIVTDTNWPDGAILHKRGSLDRYVISGGIKQLIAGSFDERNDQCVSPGVFGTIPTGDLDGDGVLDDVDNCPAWPNAGQQLPPWSVPENDPDCDGFNTTTELFVGTVASNPCAADAIVSNEPLPDKWPLDFNDDQLVSTADVGFFVDVLNTAPPNPLYSVRYDLDMNGIITTADVGFFVAFLNKTCPP